MAKKRTYKRKLTKRRRNSRKNKLAKQSRKFLGGNEETVWGLYQVTGINSTNGQPILSESPMRTSDNRNDFNEYETNEGFVIKKL